MLSSPAIKTQVIARQRSWLLSRLERCLIAVFLSWLAFLLPLIFGFYFLPLYLLALCLSFWLILKNPVYGFWLVISLTFIFERFFTLTPFELAGRVIKLYPVDFLLGFIAAAWLLSANDFWSHLKDLAKMPMAWGLGFLFLLSLWAAYRGVGNLSINNELALGSFKNLAYLLIAGLAPLVIREREEFLSILKVIIFSGVFLLFFFFYGLANGQGLWTELTPGLRFLAASHAFYLAVAFFFTLTYFIWQEAAGEGRPFWQVILFLELAALVGSMFRHIWLGVISGLVLLIILGGYRYFLKIIKKVGLIILLSIMVLISSWWFFALSGGEAAKFFQQPAFLKAARQFNSLRTEELTAEGTASWRLSVWRASQKVIKQAPLVGTGFGSQVVYYYNGTASVIEARGLHNSFLSVAVQLGGLGFLALVAIIVIHFNHLRRLIFSRQLIDKTIGLSLLGATVVSLLGLLTAIYLEVNATAIIFWLLIGLGWAAYRQKGFTLKEFNQFKST